MARGHRHRARLHRTRGRRGARASGGDRARLAKGARLLSLRTRWRSGDRFLVRHKDAAILVVEKKAGLLTVPAPSGKGASLLGLLREFVGGQGRNPVYAVHRLDRGVSGLLVFARREDTRQDLTEQFAAHTVDRRYVAGVRGLLSEDRGTYTSFLDTEGPSLKVHSAPEERGKRAVTHWRVLERFERAEATLVEVTLETGLRNQIRVHFSEDGHPLLGEKKYLEGESSQGAVRIFLHAELLGFDHPITHERMTFEAPLPPDLVRWRSALEHGRSEPPRLELRRDREKRLGKKRRPR